ncbi:ABC transport system ATP-binding protein [Thermosulfidibacter takaii ABI70S6]|uniref:ABC transport system ATP-binding protein n=1 Tax=Thermosulfidibacter takaii (strain DSM 17441 / JCM 13301 / NBRC 103674 / ABI70S6) TaxID=1298851 RepID=A0A0S3QV21_THET7|nr:ABC transporter ATP-binding protein [Thermosulfidibacter takaii]BAT72167.1 ABC transport system ATP-binding protein [Thermosulfidibacter takaii ABI70S6]
MVANVIDMKGIRKIYTMGAEKVEVLRGVDFVVKKGDFIAIMGPSGEGKSTLMNIMGCLDRPTEGKYLLEGVDVLQLGDKELSRLRNRKIGFIFQQFHLIPWATALENVLLPLVYRNGVKKEDIERAKKLLERLGLGHRMEFRPGELSGGQQQRVAIARALIGNPSIVLADEPTGNLDATSSEEVMRIFKELNEEGITIVMTTHDPETAKYAKQVKVIKNGRFVQ